MTDIIRKSATGEAGNPGQFGTHVHDEAAVALATTSTTERAFLAEVDQAARAVASRNRAARALIAERISAACPGASHAIFWRNWDDHSDEYGLRSVVDVHGTELPIPAGLDIVGPMVALGSAQDDELGTYVNVDEDSDDEGLEIRDLAIADAALSEQDLLEGHIQSVATASGYDAALRPFLDIIVDRHAFEDTQDSVFARLAALDVEDAEAIYADCIAPAVDRAERLLGIDAGAQSPQCPRHGGDWGDDPTCSACTDEDGDPRPFA